MSFRKKTWGFKLSKTKELETTLAAETLRTTVDYINAAKRLMGHQEVNDFDKTTFLRKQKKPSKIVTALRNVPSIPIELEKFSKKYEVSPNVLKQSRRFVRDMHLDDVGNIIIKKDKDTGIYFIHKK